MHTFGRHACAAGVQAMQHAFSSAAEASACKACMHSTVGIERLAPSPTFCLLAVLLSVTDQVMMPMHGFFLGQDG